MQRFGRYRPRHQSGALILCLWLAGCASAPEVETVVTVVEAPLPKPPAGALRGFVAHSNRTGISLTNCDIDIHQHLVHRNIVLQSY